MPKFLKGNYPLKSKHLTVSRKRGKNLTEQVEASALAKLGGSMCFVMKRKTFVWTPEGTRETPGPSDH